MTGSSGKPKLEIVAATDAHAAELAAFYATVWDAQGSAGDVVAARAAAAERNLVDPGQAPPTFLAMQGGRVLGHVGTTPIRIWDGRTTLKGYWMRDLMVLPEYRNGPLGFGLLKEAAAHIERSAVLTIVPASRRLFEALGYEDLGALPHYLRPLAPGRILHRLDVERLGIDGLPGWARGVLGFGRRTGLAFVAGAIGGALARAATAAARLPASGIRERATWPSGPEAHLDSLWEAARASVGTSVVRDGAYLIQKYGAPQDGDHHWVGVWRGDVLSGVAIMRAPGGEEDGPLPGLRVATLEDLVVDPSGAACLALLGAVERRARSFDADGIAARLSSARLRSSLRLQGYVRVPGNVHFFIRDVSHAERRLRGPLTDWWLTRGDG